jgi:hypothetical protein
MAAVAPIITAVAGLTTIGASIYGLINAPKPPSPKIPRNIFNQIQARLPSISGLSEQARQNIAQALEQYRAGQLLPQYKNMLDEAYRQKYEQVMSNLSARGLANSSVALQAKAELDRWYQNTYYDLLNQQLKTALSQQGLAQADIDILTRELQAYGAATQGYLAGTQASAMTSAGAMQGLSSGFSSLSKAWEDWQKSAWGA